MVYVSLYCIALLFIGILSYRKSNSFEAFVVAGRNKGTMLVALSLLATVLGASSTLGVAAMAHKIGFPAFWWLGAGVIGLIFQAIFLTRKVSSLQAYTLGDVAYKTLGPLARTIISVIIVVAWVGIIAAQFVAAGHIVMSMTGCKNITLIIVIISFIIILYTFLGGQLSILKTDFFQFIILAGAILLTVGFLYSAKPGSVRLINLELLNTSFTSFDLIYFICIVGGSFFVGPDMFSRVFTAKDGTTAQRSVFVSAAVLIFISVAIVLIGMWAKTYGTVPANLNPLTYIINTTLPYSLGVVLNLGLLSAVISSADTCLISSTSIAEFDLLKKNNVKLGRVMVLIIGLLSIGLALFFQNIIKLLITAYSVYTSGVVIPLTVGVFAYGKRHVAKEWVLAAIIGGGTLGVIASLSGNRTLALAGLALSLVCSLVAFVAGKKIIN